MRRAGNVGECIALQQDRCLSTGQVAFQLSIPVLYARALSLLLSPYVLTQCFDVVLVNLRLHCALGLNIKRVGRQRRSTPDTFRIRLLFPFVLSFKNVCNVYQIFRLDCLATVEGVANVKGVTCYQD